VSPNSHGVLREAANMQRDCEAFTSVATWATDVPLHLATHCRHAADRHEVSSLLGHSRICQTTDTYAGHKIISTNPAHGLVRLTGVSWAAWGSNQSLEISEPLSSLFVNSPEWLQLSQCKRSSLRSSSITLAVFCDHRVSKRSTSPRSCE
jgi:hypothetical protein